MSPRLCLHFLGPPKIELDNEPVSLERRKAQALLIYLAIESDGHSRESLSTLLWPDYNQSNAFKNLRQVLWEIQKTIGEGWLITNREKVQLTDDPARVWLDVHEFESMFANSRAQKDASLQLLADSAKLYRNHFLTGFSLKDAHPFNDWVFAKAEDLRHKFSILLSQLSEIYCAIGQAFQAIPYARRLVSLDPLNEASHRQLMQVYIQAGQHSAALKQYQVCEQILRKELNLDPQPETRELYKKIRKRDVRPLQVEQKAVHTPLHNIPAQIISFIGREKELKAVAKLIASHRLVTLIGAGGIGKTRLSLQVGMQLVEQFPHGVWFVELASLSDPSLIPQAVGSVFDIVEQFENTLPERLVHFLQAKSALLIFDNCEHLIEACAQLAESLLARCPTLKILATSREALGVPGEALYRVPSLSMPKVKQDADALASYEAIRLFTDRARLSASGFLLTEQNAPAVVQICRRLDGIPLAIELAAARVSLLSLEQIAARLNESFQLLTSNSRTKLERQQTLQASIEWSWNLLSEEERVLLKRLSIFAGGWTLEAAESVCEGGTVDRRQILDLLTQLVMKSLVVVDQEITGERRYHLMEMIRQYAHEKFVNSVDERNTCILHLKHFLALSIQARVELRGPSWVDWMARLHDERNNLRAALHWAEKTDVEAGLFLASQLLRFWESSDMREGIQWLESFLHKEGSNSFPRAKARALHAYASLLLWLQNVDQARLRAEECLSLFRAAGDREGEVDGLLLLCNIFMFKNDRKTAHKLAEQILALSHSLNDPWREATALYYLGRATRDYDVMFSRWEKAISLFRQVGDQVSLASVLGWLGQFRVLNGDIDLAETYLDEAMQLWQSHKRANIWDNTKMTKSLIVLLRGDFEQADAMLHEILETVEETGNTMLKFWVKLRLGYVALRSGNLMEAYQFLKEAAYKFEADGHMVGVLSALEGTAGFFSAVGKPDCVARLIGWSDAFRLKFNDKRPNIEQADVDQLIAYCLATMGESAFSDAYDEGKAMSLEYALAFAFEKG